MILSALKLPIRSAAVGSVTVTGVEPDWFAPAWVTRSPS